MSAVVIDTNILLVADGQAPHMSPACRIECLNRLERAKATERVVLDQQRLILEEYGRKLNPSKRPPSPGCAFLKWLLVNQANAGRVDMVHSTLLTSAERASPSSRRTRGWRPPSIHRTVSLSPLPTLTLKSLRFWSQPIASG